MYCANINHILCLSLTKVFMKWLCENKWKETTTKCAERACVSLIPALASIPFRLCLVLSIGGVTVQQTSPPPPFYNVLCVSYVNQVANCQHISPWKLEFVDCLKKFSSLFLLPLLLLLLFFFEVFFWLLFFVAFCIPPRFRFVFLASSQPEQQQKQSNRINLKMGNNFKVSFRETKKNKNKWFSWVFDKC